MYDFKKVEEETRKFWKKNEKKFKQSVEDDKKKKIFSFLEGPPTANAPPGLHHLEVRTYKDIINKFKFMQGFSVPRKGGWDCHGLPVEVQVEKQLNLKSKKDVLIYGVDKFIKKARDSVFSYIKDWEKSTEELNYLVDLESPYRTLDNNYIESVWWSLKELHKKKLLYEGRKVVPFCPRCGTPLSSHEVALGYKEVSQESAYVLFRIKGTGNEYFLAWTTTPWTLPGNVALAVGKDIEYVKVRVAEGHKIILSKDKLNVIDGEHRVLEKMKGKDLVGLQYEPLFDIPETQNKNSHKVIAADFVSTEEGTGIVHTAVMYGEDDYNIGMKLGLPAVHTVGQDGKFLSLVPKLEGKFVKSAEKEIVQDLKDRNLIYKTEQITHTYPFCWRCETPLLYYAINSWFIAVTKVRDKMMALNKKINWEPKHIQEGRFGKWLEGAKDWALSRFKFWGTPLPIWRCDSCGHDKIIGSVAELKKNAKGKISGEIDLHKPWIDHIKMKCEKCMGEMSRIPDVIDCWYDSGSASFAQFHYPFENKKEFERRFPYDFLSEAIDQTRGWFYTMHVLSTILFGKAAYKNVICAGHIVDEKGEKMSKSKGNVINPREIIDKVGVDAIRLEFCTADAGANKGFSHDLAKSPVIPFLNVLYNLQKFNTILPKKKNKKKIEDKWIISELNDLISKVTEELKKYQISEAFLKIKDFVVDDFSRKYVQMTRDREDTREVVSEVLKKTSLLLAPFAPYITESIYADFSSDSVHLSSWPKAEEKKIDISLNKSMRNTFTVIEKGLAERDKVKIGLRWPLKSCKVELPKNVSISKELIEIIKNQLNVKNVILKHDSKIKDIINLKFHLDTKQTPDLEAEGYAREISRKIQDFRKQLGLQKKDIVELLVVVDEEFREILDKNKNFIKERTNAKKFEIVTPAQSKVEERFKNKIDFTIKEKRGRIAIIVTKQ